MRKSNLQHHCRTLTKLALNMALFALAIMLAGCASYSVKVDSLVAPGGISDYTSYVLVPMDENISASDLQFQEYAKQIDAMLAAKGLVKASKFEEASQIVVVGYRISDPKTNIKSSSTPIWGQTGISGSQTHGTYNADTGSYSGMTTYSPTFGITGYQTSTYSYDTYTRNVYLASFRIVRGAKKNAVGEQLWQVNAVSTGSSSDLRSVFPAMLTAIKDYIGVNSGKAVTVSIDVNDPSKIIK